MSIKGTSTTPDNPGNSPLMKWIAAHLDYRDDDCLIWPFSRATSGYGSLGRNGRQQYVHRYICEWINGPAPEGHQAAHSCGRGHQGCVHPKHVSWKTPSGNQHDRVEHGTQRVGWNKLIPEQVAQIRAVTGLELPRNTANHYGVSEATIRQIQTYKTWRTGKIEKGGWAKTPRTREWIARRKAAQASAQQPGDSK